MTLGTRVVLSGPQNTLVCIASGFAPPEVGFGAPMLPPQACTLIFFKSKFSPKLQESSITRQLLSLKISLLV